MHHTDIKNEMLCKFLAYFSFYITLEYIIIWIKHINALWSKTIKVNPSNANHSYIFQIFVRAFFKQTYWVVCRTQLCDSIINSIVNFPIIKLFSSRVESETLVSTSPLYWRLSSLKQNPQFISLQNAELYHMGLKLYHEERKFWLCLNHK